MILKPLKKECLSSVYLYFDTAYSHLNLGTYSACVEILLSQLAKRPYYYMGYYIHTWVLSTMNLAIQKNFFFRINWIFLNIFFISIFQEYILQKTH